MTHLLLTPLSTIYLPHSVNSNLIMEYSIMCLFLENLPSYFPINSLHTDIDTNLHILTHRQSIHKRHINTLTHRSSVRYRTHTHRPPVHWRKDTHSYTPTISTQTHNTHSYTSTVPTRTNILKRTQTCGRRF